MEIVALVLGIIYKNQMLKKMETEGILAALTHCPLENRALSCPGIVGHPQPCTSMFVSSMLTLL